MIAEPSRPSRRATRTTLAALSLALLAALLAFVPQQAAAQNNYTDTAGHYSHDSINFLVDHGILGDAYITECARERFCPERPLERWVSVVWLVRALTNGEDPAPVSSSSFSDVAHSDYYAPHLEFLVSLGLVKGYPDGTFRPFEPVARRHMNVMLRRGLDNLPTDNATNIWHGALASALCNEGSSVCPWEKVTRGESATVLAAAIQGQLAQSPIESPSGQFWDINVGIAAGAFHTCALRHGGRDDDRIACWGFNHFGQLDQPHPDYRYKVIAAGGNHTCAIRRDDIMDCWGSNSFGQTDVPEGRYKNVAAGGASTCAIRTNHKMVCWGKNYKGFTRAAGELLEPPTHSFDNLDVGAKHACAIGRGRHGQYNRKRLSCWGHEQAFEVTRLPDHDSSIQWYGIATGIGMTCGFYTTVWGHQQLRCEGQRHSLRQHTNEPPEERGTLYRENTIGVGWWHACVLRQDRTPWCWGENAGSRGTPTDEIFNMIAVGGAHTCGVRPDRTIRCWGFQDFQL